MTRCLTCRESRCVGHYSWQVHGSSRFPATWPVFPHAYKLADWLESYATALELDVWTSSEVTRASQDPTSLIWSVDIAHDGKSRTLCVPHLVFALGVGGGVPKMPNIPGQVSSVSPETTTQDCD